MKYEQFKPSPLPSDFRWLERETALPKVLVNALKFNGLREIPGPQHEPIILEMADYLGLTLETVSRQMSALKRDGVIILDGKRHVTIPDLERLMEEAGDDSDGGVPE